MVLLQNKSVTGSSPLLPFSNKPQKIALIGPLADNTQEMIGSWGNNERAPDVVTVKDALEARARQSGGSLVYAKGTEISGNAEDGFSAAVEAAKQSDIVVLALGESSEMSGEAGSRASLDLPGNQEKLLEAVASTGQANRPDHFLRTSLGFELGRATSPRHNRGVVPRNRSRLCNRGHTLRRHFTQR